MIDSTISKDRRDNLIEKYGRDLVENPPLVTARRFREKLALRDLVDQNWAKISMEWAAGVLLRPALDLRSRYLILLGQFTVTKNHGYLEDAIDGGIGAGVSPRELLESILISQIYCGETVVEPALAIFVKVARERGVLDQLRNDQLPIDGPVRDLEKERPKWPSDLVNDERADDLIEKYGWRGVSTGVHYRGTHHLDSLEYLSHLDLDWGQHWEKFAYQGVYSRRILNDKTRLLCTTADCLASGGSGSANSARDHMEEAMEFGATPSEVLELIFQSGVYFGFPGVTAARTVLIQILTDQGRLEEVGLAPAIRHKSL